MQDSDIIAIIVSVFALLVSVCGVFISSKYSKSSLIHSLHELTLQKAKDCNILFEKAQDTTAQSLYEIEKDIAMINTISELTISRQLITKSVKEYCLKGKENFFLLQFWIQLNTSFRIMLKRQHFANLPSNTQKQISDFRAIFQPFFEEY